MPTHFNTKTNSKSNSLGPLASFSRRELVLVCPGFSLWDLSQKFGSASTLADQKNETAYVWQAGKIHAMGLAHPKTEEKQDNPPGPVTGP